MRIPPTTRIRAAGSKPAEDRWKALDSSLPKPPDPRWRGPTRQARATGRAGKRRNWLALLFLASVSLALFVVTELLSAGPDNSTAQPGPDKVQSLFIEARLANWDRDAAADGVELRIVPLTADNRLVAIAGVLQGELVSRNLSPAPREDALVSLGKWSQQVRVSDFARFSGAFYRLPFSSPHWEPNPTVLSYGWLRVRLQVAGQGQFSAETTVRVRSHNPTRDQVLEYERTHDAFGRYRARHW